MTKINVSDFLKPTDINGTTTVEFVDEGEYRASQFKDPQGNAKTNFNITVKVGAEEKTWTMNKTSQRSISTVFGTETSAWIGAKAVLHIEQMRVGAEMRDVIYGEPVPGETTTDQQVWPE